MLQSYETTIIVTPVLTDAELKDLLANYVKLLKDNGAEIVHEDYWGLRQLAYPINKKTSGFYFTVEHKSPGELIEKVELLFKRDDSVMRFLTVKLDKFAVDYNDRKRQGLVGKNRKKDKEEEVKEEA